ncbi:MAG TPA: CBS domain-containing protein [Polyangiaceae bacterium]
MSTSPASRPRKRTPFRRATATKPPIIKHWMTKMPWSITKDQTLLVAHALMTEHHIRHLPVLERGKLVGVVSQRDLYFLETIPHVDLSKEHVEEAMSQDVYCVSPEAHLADVVYEMVDRKYGCALVVEGTNVVGIFTTIDALSLLASRLRKTR